MFVYADLHYRFLDDGSFKTHVFIWREGIWRNGKEREVGFYKHHIRGRPLYVMPLASTFLDEESMDGCIRKAVEWCEGLPSYDTTHVQKMELTETIGVTLKDVYKDI
jgi:hypothetical protein